MKTIFEKYLPFYAKDADGNEIPDEQNQNEEVKEWQTRITSLEATIQELSQKLGDVEGRPNPNEAAITDLQSKLSSLETKLTAAETELAEAKQRREAKASRKTQSTRKQSLAQKNQSNSEGVESREAERKRPRKAWL